MFHCKQNMMNEDYLHIQGNVLHVLNVSVQTTTNKNNALRLLELLLLTAIWGGGGGGRVS